MFHTKSDIDGYVQTSLQKLKTEKERNLRSLHVAQLYVKVGDFDSARKYVLMYLSEKEDSASAHKLHGDTLEGLGQKSKAITAYTKSLELDAAQPGLFLKICELLGDKDVEFNPSVAKYCLEHAGSFFPHAPAVFALREKLLTTDSSVTQDDVEKLIVSELKARPTDVNVRVKLLKLQLESQKVELAYNHINDVEAKQLHINSHVWYQCSTKIFQAYYDNFPKKCNWEFFIMWMSALDRLCVLSLNEINGEPCDIVTITEAIYTLDQTIYLSSRKISKAPEIYLEFVKHVTGQLAFHIVVLLMKRAKKESSLWKETKRNISPLLLFSACEPTNTDANWSMSIKEAHRKMLNNWVHDGRCRYAQSGYLLSTLVKECQTNKMFLDKVNHFAATDWRKKIFEKTFLPVDDISSLTSHFVTSSNYATVPQKVPSIENLHASLYVQSFEVNYIGSLHHLVWLGVQLLRNSKSILTCQISPMFHSTQFKNLQLTVSNLHNTGVETLNQLDVDAFLYATVLCTGAVLEDQQVNGYYSPDRPALLPADITANLCNAEQSKWWTSACALSKGGGRGLGNNVKMSDLRHSLQRGIEVVRGDGMPLPVLIGVARTFGLRGSVADSIDESDACESRAVALWRNAIPILEKMCSNQSTNKFASKTPLFEYFDVDLKPNEINALLDEARYFIASYYMRKEQYEKALELFKLLRSPDSNYNMATIYFKLAEEQISGLRGEEITSDLRCKQQVLGRKAREALVAAREAIKGEHNHPLQNKIKSTLIDVEDLLSRAERENGIGRDGIVTDDSYSYESQGESVEKLATPLKHIKNLGRAPAAASTPRNYEAKLRHNAEMVELLSSQQDTNQLKLTQIMEQSKLVLDRMDSIIFEQRSQRSLIEDLTAKFNRMETEVKNVLADIKKEVKRPDLYNMLDDDDYTADEMLQYPVYPPVNSQVPSRVVMYPNQRPAVTEPQFPTTVPQYFSPRIDQMYQNGVNFFSTQGTLPFVDGQTVPDYLRGLNQPKFPAQLQNTLGAPIHAAGHLNQAQVPSMLPNPTLGIPGSAAGLLHQPRFASLGPLSHVVPDQGLGGRGPNNIVITTSDTLPTGTPPAQPMLSVTIPPQHRLGDSSASHQFQLYFPDFNSILNNLKGYSVFNKSGTVYKYADQKWEEDFGSIYIIRSKIDEKYGVVMVHGKYDELWANHMLTFEVKLEQSGDSSWSWVTNHLVNDKVEKLKVRFNNPADAASFKKECDELVGKPKVASSSSASQSSILSAEIKLSSASDSQRSTVLAPSRFSFAPQQTSPFSTPGQLSSEPKPTSATTSPLVTSSLANKSPLFSNQQTTPSTLFGKDPSKTPNSSSSIATTSTPVVSTPSAAKTVLGGFTFSSTPTLTTPVETKQPLEKVAEPKKTDSPFANFSFSSSSENTSFRFFGGRDQPKPSEPLKSSTEPNKPQEPSKSSNLMFSGASAQFTDFGSFAKASANQSLLKPSPDSKSKSGTVFAGSGAPVFRSQIISPQQNKMEKPSSEQESGSQEMVEDFVPTADFKPLIPLPALVDVVSGEENEEVLFSERAKLFRYDKENKEWRDRGIGMMKILKNNETGVVRLLMRREQVLKVCCNHRLTKELKISKSKTNENAYCWIAADFSDDTNGAVEHFTIKFKTSEQASKFTSSFTEAQEMYCSQSPSKADQSSSTVQKVGDQDGISPTTPLSSLFKKNEGSWDCAICYVNNGSVVTSCIACNTPKPGTEPSPKKDQKPKSMFSFGMPSTSPGITSSLVGSQELKPAGQTVLGNTGPKVGEFSFGIPPASLTTASPFGKPPGDTKTGFLFGMPQGKATSSSTTTSSSTAENDSIKGSHLASIFKSKEESWECKGCQSTNNSTLMVCNKCSTARPSVTITTMTTGPAQNFSLEKLAATLPTSQPSSLTQEVTITKKDAPNSSLKFGFSAGNKPFGADHSDAPKAGSQVFSFGGSDTTEKKTFQFSMSSVNTESPGRNDSVTSDLDVSDREESEDNIHFQPVIPLPDLVAVKTGEEDEKILYSQRAKLFRFDDKAKEWKERGVGDVKIMEHVGTGKRRLLMRREPVKKLSLNHYLNDEIVLTSKDEKSWMWVASDFALGEVSQEKFAIRFKTKEIAQEFYDAVEKAKCESSAPGSLSASSAVLGDSALEADDVEYVTTITASEDLKAKARALMLPENFYLYLDRPPCPGCKGCEREEDEALPVLVSSQPSTKSVELPSHKTTEPSSIFKAATLKAPETPTLASSPLKPIDPTAPILQPIFGSASSIFPFTNANFSFGQKPVRPTDKTSSHSSPQPFFASQKGAFTTSDSPAPVNTSIFGNISTTTQQSSSFSQSTSETSSMFSKPMPSFSSVASNTPVFGSGASSPSSFFNKTESSPFMSGGYRGQEEGNGADDDNDPEKEAQGIHFEPVIPLPEEIQLSTGEEDEEVLFSERCKLYRFLKDEKNQWKERGVGIMKVLKHKTNNTYRLLMRREQVHKVVCNQRITTDLEFQPMSTQPSSITWAAMNLPQEFTEPKIETLALKLKNEAVMSKFIAVVKGAIESLKA